RFTIDADELGYYDDDDVPDWTFEVAAAAGAKVGESATSNAVDPYKAPELPAGAKPTGTAANGQSTVSWPKAAANGRAVTYTIEWCQGATCTNFANGANVGAALKHTVTGLTNARPYRFRVTPRNAAGAGRAIVSDAVTPIG